MQQLLGPLQAGETQVACSAGERDVCARTSDWKSHPDIEVPEEHDVITGSPKKWEYLV